MPLAARSRSLRPARTCSGDQRGVRSAHAVVAVALFFGAGRGASGPGESPPPTTEKLLSWGGLWDANERGGTPMREPVSEPLLMENNMEDETRIRFRLGRIAVEREALEALHPDVIREAIADHSEGRWGYLDAWTQAENEQALFTGASITSVHDGQNGVWFQVRTNGDRTVTSVTIIPVED